MKNAAAQAGFGLGVLAFTLALLAIMLAAAGYSPGPAIGALWRGSLGSWYAFTSVTLVRATPLLLGGLATTIAFRAGVLNIGVEGQLLAGATLATWLALGAPWLGPWLIPFGLCAGVVGGMAWATTPALLKRRFGVLEVISTLMLNAVAVQLVGWAVRGPLQEPTHVYPQSALVPRAAQLPLIVSGTRLHAGFALAVALTALTWWLLSRTAVGFRMRVTGANPRAAASAGGIDVPALATGAFLVSGALAGLAGAVEVHGVTFALYESLSPGYGYTAIAVALLARLDARAIAPSAVFFASLETGASAMQRDVGVPASLVQVVEALLILIVLAFDARNRIRQAAIQGSGS